MDYQPAIVALLALLSAAVIWLGIQAYQIRRELAPVLGSSIVTGLSSI